jgi:hypothetical protein
MELEDEKTTHRDSNGRWLPGKSANLAEQKMTSAAFAGSTTKLLPRAGLNFPTLVKWGIQIPHRGVCLTQKIPH